MTHIEYSIRASDGFELYAQQWLPDGQHRGVVNLVHGLGEHSGRYAHVAHAFNQAGLAVNAIDLRGHGKSGGTRGHIPSYERASKDIIHLVEKSLDLFPGKKQFLYGHSLGGALVLFTSLYHNPPVTGTIATSPGLNPGVVPPFKLVAARVLSSILPEFSMKNGLELNNLSHDQAVIEQYKNDPYVHPMISSRLGYELIANGKRIASYQGKFPVPLLLLQGAQDRLVSPKTNQQFAENLSGQVTFKMFEQGFHELHNEPWKEIVIKTMTDWMEQRLLD